MYSLMASYDCGANYLSIQEAGSVEELRTNIEKCDKEGLRWCIEDDSGEIHDISPVHKKIVLALAMKRST